jgi:nucleoside-diphosphate-sugar epimerase
MSSPRVTVFGGTGLLGRRIVHHLHDADFAVRIAARHPEASIGFGLPRRGHFFAARSAEKA